MTSMSSMKAFLDGKVALVTGASRGIGRAIALALAHSGAHVGVNCLHSEEEGRAVCRAIEEMDRRAVLALGDTRQEQDVDHVVSSVEEGLGPVAVG